jgi:hypothetical protein
MRCEKWLWYGGIGVLVGALALIIALLLGRNSPRPTAPPDWRAPGLPLTLVAPPDESAVMLLDHSSDDFILEIEATPLSGPTSDFNGYGLVYRAQDVVSYYVFAVGSDGYYAVLRVAGGEETPLADWQQFPHVRRGQQTNRLRVACTGPTCRFYVNDEYATTVEDATWLAGDVGLWVHSFGDASVVVQFANVGGWKDKGWLGVRWALVGELVIASEAKQSPTRTRFCGKGDTTGVLE